MGDPLPLPLPTVSSTTGAMNSLLDKLTAMEEAQHPTLGESRLRLLEHLEGLNDVLHKLARPRRRDRDALVNEWMLQAREVTYDMEDWIDGNLTQITPNSEPDGDVAEQAEDFKAQIQDAHDRCTRYALLHSSEDAGLALADAAPSSSSRVTVDAKAKLLYGEAPYLVAINELRETLVQRLMDQEQHRKVVSIVGTGGIGKTALATEIYRHLQGRFNCGAFVYLGRNPCIKTTLFSILKQVYPYWNYDMDSRDEQKIIAKLWAFLTTRSYFVVLDDVQSIRTWKIISCALPNNDQAADRILITTCVKDIAESCCTHPSDVVHHMEGLGKDHSKTLFDGKISVSGNSSLHQVSEEMLKMCGGIPLAITVTAGLLSWESACFLLKSNMLDQYQSTPQGMRKKLEMSYADLPLPVKSCFLYLGAFPENNTIKKDRLIRRWIAEGFVPKRDEESLWETGESYFEELIGRRLIQPAFDDDEDGEPIGCTVHVVVLDFMVSLSAEENFITAAGAELKPELFPCDWVRRFCLHCTSDEDEDKDQADKWSSRLHLSRVRSLAFSGNARRMPDVGALRFVRVLDLEDTKGLGNEQLGSIRHLCLLKYLGLVGTAVTSLPPQIMALKRLTTLDVRRTRVKRLPARRDRDTDTELVSVLADELRMLGGMEAMLKLEELSRVVVGPDGSDAGDVARLVRRLRMLGVRFGRLNEQNEGHRRGVKHILEEVGKSNLQSFLLDSYPHGLLDLLVDSWAHKRPHHLRKFELRARGCLPQVPRAMASLVDLTHLHIRVSVVEQGGVRALGGLPNLVLLRLHSDTSPRLTLSSNDGFPCLKVFWYLCQYDGIRFEAGAMPQLRRLGLHLDVQETIMCDFSFGFQHLSCLVQLRATIDCQDSRTASEGEAHIRGQVSQNRNNPALELRQKAKANAAEEAVIEIHSKAEWITQIDPNRLVVVHFTEASCTPSRVIAPVFAHLASENPNAIFLKVDVVEMADIAAQFGVRAVPAFLFMTGGDIVDRVVGASKQELLGAFDLQKTKMLSKVDV